VYQKAYLVSIVRGYHLSRKNHLIYPHLTSKSPQDK